jgi:hypothetical protein
MATTAMALADDRRLADGAYHRRESGGREMSEGKQAPFDASTLRIAGWAGVVLATIGLLGLIYAPSLLVIWIVMLVFAVSAVPQALFATRGGQRRGRHRRVR